MERKYGALSSSTNPDQLAATITGLIISFASLIVLFAGHLGFSLTIEQVTTYAGELGTGIGAIWTVFGILRKITVAIYNRFFKTA